MDDLFRLHNRMKQMMDELLYQLSPRFMLEQRNWNPQIDVVETPEAYLVVAEVAGLIREEIQVTVKGNRVYLAGKRKRPVVESGGRYLQMEITYGSFERTFEFPLPIDEGGIEAHYREGLLTLVLPKRSSMPKTIPVESE